MKAVGEPLSKGGVVDPDFEEKEDAGEAEDELKDLPLKPSPVVTSRPVSISAPRKRLQQPEQPRCR